MGVERVESGHASKTKEFEFEILRKTIKDERDENTFKKQKFRGN
tara:strand:+ start:8 stop:139 length:132 start_codon:yes stop_codon:yes gene_type:complete